MRSYWLQSLILNKNTPLVATLINYDNFSVYFDSFFNMLIFGFAAVVFAAVVFTVIVVLGGIFRRAESEVIVRFGA